MSMGRLIAVVGPSGVGKDSIMDGLKAARPDLRLVRRWITRAPELGGEEYHAVSPDAFEAARRGGAFCLAWGAHGLRYGIPAQVLRDVQTGTDCLANLSRSVLGEAAARFPALIVLNITATPETLARRLAGRGRETPEQIKARLGQADKPLPPGLDVRTVTNDGPLDAAIARACALLQP